MRKFIAMFAMAAMVFVGGAAGINVDGPVDAEVTVEAAAADAPGPQSSCLHYHVKWYSHYWFLKRHYTNWWGHHYHVWEHYIDRNNTGSYWYDHTTTVRCS